MAREGDTEDLLMTDPKIVWLAFGTGAIIDAATIAFAGYVWMCVCNWLAGRKP